jgi:DNA-binding Lrp family transcriptional regulator
MLKIKFLLTAEVIRMRPLDRTDARVLLALDDDPQATTVALAGRLDLARNTVQARQHRLELEVMSKPSRRLDPVHLGYPLMAFVTLEISQGDLDATVESLQHLPEILELQATTGDGDLVARVVALDPNDLHRVTRQMLESPSVTRTRTSLALRELIPHRIGPLLERLAGTSTPSEASRSAPRPPA